MSYPFIIWTMQRTGGTSLAELLMQLSEHEPAEHEPFNWQRNPRQFALVTRAWAEKRDAAALQKGLSEILSRKFLIKHCYEFHDPGFNRELLLAAAKTDYRHIHLLRRDEVSRLVSKFIAEGNGTWFKDYSDKVYAEIRSGQRRLAPLPVNRLLEQYRHARRYAETIRRALRQSGVAFEPFYYEDLFTGERLVRMLQLADLLRFLGFDRETIEQNRPLVDEKIFGSGQDTASVMSFLPNLEEVVGAFAAAGYHGVLPPAARAVL